MEKRFIITKEEKNRILEMHKNATKKNYLFEQDAATDVTAKGYSTYSANINNYPECIKMMGKPTKVKEEQLREFTHGVMGTGRLKGYTFFPFPVGDENKWTPDKSNQASFNKPGSYDVQSRIKYSCKSGMIEVEGKIYPPSRIPTTIDQLAKGGFYLRQGDKGPIVERIQSQLQASGELVKTTSVFDADTTAAVKSFQTKNQLKPDGIVGKNTWEKLSKVSAEIKTAQPKTITKVDSNAPQQTVQTRYGMVGPQPEEPAVASN